MRDLKHIMAESDSLTGISAGSTSIIGDVLNFGSLTGAFGASKTPDIGVGEEVEFKCICQDTAFTSSGSPSITIALVTAADASLSSGAVTLLSLAGIVKASGTDGAVLLHGKVPPTVVKQYIGTKVTVATAALTAGKISSWLNIGEDSTITQKK